jgi:hypothetical protein
MCSSKDQWFEAWDDYYAKQDDIRERYHRETQDIKNEALIEQEHTEYMTRVWDAGYGTDTDAYEAYWSRVFDYFQNQPKQELHEQAHACIINT